MKVLVAAEDSGSLKEISFPFGTNTSVQQFAQPAITTFASAGRSSYVQRMIIAKLDTGKEYICIARKGGIVQLYDIDSPHTPFVEWKDMTHPSDDAFVGLEYVEGKLSSCTATGKLIMRDLHSISDSTNEYYTLLGEPINAFRVHPNQPNVIAYGGKERELEISIIQNMHRRESDSNTDSESDRSSSWYIAAIPTGRSLSHRKLWKAKNVKNDELDLRVPVWISDIRFLDVNRNSGTDFRVVVSTRFGHVRVYETKYSRKPIVNVEVGDHPLIALSPYINDNEIIYCDTNSTTARFNLINGRNGGHYSGAAGSILCLDSFFPEQEQERARTDANEGDAPSATGLHSGELPLLATGGLDRYLRIYNLQTREIVAKVFVGAKLSAVCIVDGNSAVPSEHMSERESDEEDDEETVDGGRIKTEGERKRRKKLKVQEGGATDGIESNKRQKRARLHDDVPSDDDDDDADDVWNLLDADEEESRIKKEEDDDKGNYETEKAGQGQRRR
ncbi:hypothetical protein V1525DRAFT_449219 [Lipomyces kononenkoae]|uniref:Uncharacterized protein n=1 Tax=Lipomyces kononenkoae TaxID=34357 RepID=A0ACC3T6I8_LIPKO